MCMGCVYEYVTEEHPTTIGDSLRAIVDEIRVRPAVVAAAAEVTALYKLPECSVGGPLHVVVDDTNVEDHFLEVQVHIENLPGDPGPQPTAWSPEVLDQAEKVLAVLRPLTLVERAVATVIGGTP